jgi:hypothetical protein
MAIIPVGPVRPHVASLPFFAHGGEVDTIFGFEKDADALQWIKEKSQAWLLEAMPR